MNLLMKRLGANITLPLMVTLWGMVTACQGACVNLSIYFIDILTLEQEL